MDSSCVSSGSWVVVTGGCGFIGQNLVKDLIKYEKLRVIIVDKLSYASNYQSLQNFIEDGRAKLIINDVNNASLMLEIFTSYSPVGLFHLAAESHVDRSIASPSEFIQSNVLGTYNLLQAWRSYCSSEKNYKFLHVSTDEVYGSLCTEEAAFVETSQYRPNSPYSASKAASDHFVRAWSQTFGLNTTVTNCSNNFGPYQNREKFIPTVISSALSGQPIPIYGTGTQIRDWLYVADHTTALRTIFHNATPNTSYVIGGSNELTNIELAIKVCRVLDEFQPRSDHSKYEKQIEHVLDRPGHDFRYAINSSKLEAELGWCPAYSFDPSLVKTVEWYLKNPNWL